MKKMWSKNELKNISQNEAKAVKKDIATLVDAEGHERFFTVDLDTQEIEGVTYKYAKASLSGTHLLLVLNADIVNGTVIGSGNNLFANVRLPQWILDKIIPISGSISVRRETLNMYDASLSVQQTTAVLAKYDTNDLRILTSGFTASADRNFTITFDLLIDNE